MTTLKTSRKHKTIFFLGDNKVNKANSRGLKYFFFLRGFVQLRLFRRKILLERLFCFFILTVEDQFERVRLEDIAETLVEFTHEFDPKNIQKKKKLIRKKNKFVKYSMKKLFKIN